jgi:hypothetical protein
MSPVNEAFAQLWPQASLMNLLDDCLSADLARAGSLNEAMTQRMLSLARYARTQGANGIMFTCSAFGPAIDAAAAALDVPVLKPNEAMFEEALALCAQAGPQARAGLLTTFAPAAAPMRAEFEDMVRLRGQATALESACAEDALAMLQAGQADKHDARVCEIGARSQAQVLMLGQFSMARAHAALVQITGKPVLTSPASAVRKLQGILTLS